MLERLKRMTRARLPNIFGSRERYYNFDDARMAINDLGIEIPAPMLQKLLDNDEHLDDFITALYEVEKLMGVDSILTPFATLESKYKPKVIVTDNHVAFTLHHKSEDLIFAEYTL